MRKSWNMNELIAFYREDKTGWNASIEGMPFIQVRNAQDLESARTLLELQIAEEFPRMRWEIIEEEILTLATVENRNEI